MFVESFWWAFWHIFWLVGALEVNFLHLFGIWAWLRWWSEARVRTKWKKVQKQSKTEYKNESLFVRITCFLYVFFCWFSEESWEVLFRVLVAEVLQMGATWGHFSRHVAARVENWKQRFRVHQTLLFGGLRGWFGTCWAVFFKIFSEIGLERWFYDFLRNWGSSR